MTREQIIFDLIDRACILASDEDHWRYMAVAKARLAFRDGATKDMSDFALKVSFMVADELNKGGKD